MAFDTYLKIATVDGEALQSNHEKWIEIYSFSWGASNPTTVGPGSGGLSAGRVSVSSFNVMKKTEASSAKLFAACCNGTHFADATVEMSKATGEGGQGVFLKYVFTDVMVESIQWSGSGGGDDTPSESTSFAFGQIQIDYKAQDTVKGTLDTKSTMATWDLTKAHT